MKSSAYTQLLARLPELYEAHSLEDLPRHMVDFVSGMISADVMAYNEVNLKTSRLKAAMNPPELIRSPHLRAFEVYMKEHPLIRHQQQTGDGSARKISDFLSRANYHKSSLYQEVYRHLGGEDQFALTLNVTSKTIVALAMNRKRRNFTEEHRLLLNLMQPHLIQTYRNARTLNSLQDQLAMARGLMDALPLGLVSLNRRWQIRFTTIEARRLLQSYFGSLASARILPEALRVWLLRTAHWNGRALPGATDSYSVDGMSGRLSVRFVKGQRNEDAFLILEERPHVISSQPLQVLGLTVREAEVLMWVAQGKSNPEIAIILGSARRTVQKHLERVFTKLGVETRTAAARRALEILR